MIALQPWTARPSRDAGPPPPTEELADRLVRLDPGGDVAVQPSLAWRQGGYAPGVAVEMSSATAHQVVHALDRARWVERLAARVERGQTIVATTAVVVRGLFHAACRGPGS